MEEKAKCSLIRKKQSFLRETVSLWRRALERLNWLGTLYLSLVWAVSVTQHFTPCQMGTSAPCQHYCNPCLHRIFDFKAWTVRKWKMKCWFEDQKNPTKQQQQQNPSDFTPLVMFEMQKLKFNIQLCAVLQGTAKFASSRYFRLLRGWEQGGQAAYSLTI